MFENIYGITCVENQVLYKLRFNGENIDRLYGFGFIPVNELFDDLIIKGKRPERLDSVKKIHDILKNRSVISLILKSGAPDLEKTALVMMKPEYVKRVLRARGLRDDHYALYDGSFIYNDIPDIQVKADDFDDNYQGTYLEFIQNRPLSEDDYDYFAYKPKEDRFTPPGTGNICNIGEKARNFIWIIKLLIYRIKAYGSIDCDISEINRMFAASEYYNLRKITEADVYDELISKAAGLYISLKEGIK